MPSKGGNKSLPGTTLRPKTKQVKISGPRSVGGSFDVMNDGEGERSQDTRLAKLKNRLAATRNLRRRVDENPDIRRSSGGGEQTKVAVSELEKLAQKSGRNTADERFRVMPDYAYTNTKFNREELRKEMNMSSSYFHDLRPKTDNGVGSFYVEVLQCFGIPRPDLLKETSAFCISVCGSYAFKTDVMPPVANPMWLSKMRRACIFSFKEAFARVSVGVFAKTDFGNHKDAFIGRVVFDISRCRPGCTYDVTLPLRQSSQVYSKQQCGAIRLRFHLEYHNERAALLSYLPRKMPRFHPNDEVTVRCCDNKAFQNVARVVHGNDMPSKFSMKLVKATMREIELARIHITRYIRRRELRDTMQWRYPVISCFIFVAWMHSIYYGSFRFLPGHFVTYLLMHIWKNYAFYAIDGQHDKGFSSPTWEEMCGALIFGNSERKVISPLEMERKDPDQVKSALSFFDPNSPEHTTSLQDIANALRDGVKRTDDKYSYFRTLKTFVGTDAVDFLVDNGFAESRREAIDIGIRLQKDLRLFEHVSRKYDFKDADLYYVFLNFDTSEYVFKTHKPWFKRWFRFIGFSRSIPLTDTEAHWEMPFTTGKDHPSLTIKESLIIRSKESRNLLQTMQKKEEEEDAADLGVTAFVEETNHSILPALPKVPNITGIVGHPILPKVPNLTGIVGNSSNQKKKTPERKMSDMSFARLSKSSATSTRTVDFEIKLEKDDYDRDWSMREFDEPEYEIKVLTSPPNQDITFIKRADRKVADALVESRYKTHQMFGHFFNDRSYKLTLRKDKQGKEQSSNFKRRRTTLNSVSSKRNNIFSSMIPRSNIRKPSPLLKNLKKQVDPENEEMISLTMRKDEYDRLLQLNKYSHTNVIVSKISTIIQPLVEMAQLFLCVIRALFNIFTWRDPFLTFWVAIFGSFLVVMLHIFPWRVALGVLGIWFVGPQNWLMRLLRERKIGVQPDDFNTVIKMRRHKTRVESSEDDAQAYFSSYAPDNRPVREAHFDTSDCKEVAVPYTRLNYRRFYDWPPEPEYARVWKCDAPLNDPLAESILEDDAFDLYNGGYGDDVSVRGTGWKRRAKGLVKGVARGKVKNMNLRKREPKLEPLHENPIK